MTSSAPGQILPSRTVADVPGSIAAARFGEVVAAIGDVNGDGRPDFAVAAPLWGPTRADSTGRVAIFLGGRVASDEPDLVLTGFQHGAQFGFAVAGVGDVDGDGFDDFIVTAPGFDLGDPNHYGSGRVYLYLGGFPTDGVPDVVFDPPTHDTGYRPRFFGSGLVGLGDIDGDGRKDWAVGYDNTPAEGGGGAEIYLGGSPPRTKPIGRAVDGITGGRPVLAALGDWDGDGYPDLAVAHPTLRSGYAYVSVFTRLRSTAGRLDPTHWASLPIQGFGSALVSPGDLNGDGLSDLLIGVPLTGGASQIRILFGSRLPEFNVVTFPLSFIGTLPDSFGCALATGHADGSGFVNLLVGACGDRSGGPGAGAARLYRVAPSTGTTLLATMTGSPGDYLGRSVAIPGDVDGNGEADLLIGAPRHADPADGAGAARLVTLSPHTLLAPLGGDWPAGSTAHVRWLGTPPARIELSLDDGATWRTLADAAGGAAVNDAVVSVPDTVTGRARLRIVQSGAPLDALHLDESDASIAIVRPARAWSAAPSLVSRRMPAIGEGRLGAALDTGDFDGDGIPDVAVGAPFTDAAGANSGAVSIDFGGAGREPRRWIGQRGGEAFGTSVSLRGGLDQDGRADLLVGAPARITAAGTTGGVSLFLGASPASPAVTLPGTQNGEGFGRVVRWIGDFDHDGRDDFVVAAPDYVSPSPFHGIGRVLVYFGGMPPHATPDLELDAPPGTAEFGVALAGLDLNGDGAADLAVSAVGAGGIPGSVLLYFGGARPDTVPRLVLRDALATDRFGEALADGGDLNGDGFHDLLVGAPGAVGHAGASGRVFEFLGGPHPSSTPAHVFDGEQPGEDFGAVVAGVGDLGGDGIDDVVIGAPLAGGGAGAARIFFGGSDEAADGEWSGASPGERFGAALASAAGGFVAGAPLDERAGPATTGRVDRIGVARYAVDEPAPGARWFVGSAHTIRWRGSEPADVSLSLDAGRSWSTLATGAVADRPLALTVPSTATDSAVVRVRPSNASVPGEVRVPFGITAATSVLRFDYTLETDGIHFGWRTEPALGAGAWSAYRLYRLRADGGLERVGPAAITAESWVVPDFERGGTYVLAVVDGSGVEVELARVTLPGAPAGLRVWPVPAGGGRPVEIALFPPVDSRGRTAADFSLRVYDMTGRIVRRLGEAAMSTRVGELAVSWDLRDRDGHLVRPGIYFVRAESPSRGFRVEHRAVLLR